MASLNIPFSKIFEPSCSIPLYRPIRLLSDFKFGSDRFDSYWVRNLNLNLNCGYTHALI